MAQRSFGIIYYEGRDVKRDLAEALQWFRKAAEQGHAGANEGVYYTPGSDEHGPRF